ncbi:MAG: glycosyltransferase family 61 protein [Rhodobacteraceae bacterium]|nr:glycosyltransferase family 61 protein [Paracoccaceae bacterium]
MHFREVDLETFAAETQGEIVYASRSSRLNQKSIIGLNRKPNGDLVSYINPVMIVAKLPHVVIKGTHSTPFSLQKALYTARRLTHHDSDPLWHASGWVRKTDAGIEADLGEIDLHIAEPAFLLCMGNSNFGHFIWEVVARCFMLSRIPEHQNLKILYPDTLPQRYLLWLESMGIARDRLIAIPPNSAVHADLLYVCTAPFARSSKRDLIAHEESLHYMRYQLWRGAAGMGGRTRLFFSRSDAQNKRCVNEDEVRAVLAPYDMTFVTGASTPHETMLEYVRNAELILSPLGAATAVAAFAPDDCMVVELTPSPDIFGMFNAAVSALLLGQPFTRVLGQRVELPDNTAQDKIYWDYSMEPKQIRIIMESYFLNRSRYEN